MIGRELYNFTELFEWLLSMKNKKIEGYRKYFTQGLLTVGWARTLTQILKINLELSGIYNISSIPISKYDLLVKLSNAFNLNVDI